MSIKIADDKDPINALIKSCHEQTIEVLAEVSNLPKDKVEAYCIGYGPSLLLGGDPKEVRLKNDIASLYHDTFHKIAMKMRRIEE